MKTQTIIAAAVAATAGIVTYFTRKKLAARKKENNGHTATDIRHAVHAFSKSNVATNGKYRRHKIHKA